MREHILYCPKCGDVTIDYFDNEKDRIFNKICIRCSGHFKKYELIDTNKNSGYFRDKYFEGKEMCDELLFSFDLSKEVRKEFVYENPLYDKESDMKQREVVRKIEERNLKATALRNAGIETENTPKCPTCGSSDIHKISGVNKVTKGALFGVFAIGKISKTFHCDHCKYEW